MPSKVGSDGHGYERLAWRDQGGDKPRGLANAALAHAKHGAGVEGPRGHRAPEADTRAATVPAAVIVQIGRAEVEPIPAGTYSSPRARAGALAPVAIGEGASIKANIHVGQTLLRDGAGTGGTGGSLILEEGASLKINAHIDTLVAGEGGSLILEKGASVKINAHVGTFTANGGTMVVGEGASLRLNLHADAASSGGHVIIPDGADIKANVHAKTVHAKSPAAAMPELAAAAATEPDRSAQLEDAREPAPALRRAPGKKAKAKPVALRPDNDDNAEDLAKLKGLRWRLLDELVASAERGKRKDERDDDRGRGVGSAMRAPDSERRSITNEEDPARGRIMRGGRAP